jgi:hypothetical protein
MKCDSLTLGARHAPGTRWTARDELAVRRITAAHFPSGFTILRALGGWFDPARTFRVRKP